MADAHLHPRWPFTRRWLLWPAVAVLAALAGLGSYMLVVSAPARVIAGGPDAAAVMTLDASLGLSPGPLAVLWVLTPPSVVVSVGLTLSWLLCALATRLLHLRFLPVFCWLVSVRFAADWIVFPVLFGWGGPPCGRIAQLLGCSWPWPSSIQTSAPFMVVVLAVELAGWGLLTVLLLRPTGWSAPAAFAVGCVLELLLGTGPTTAAAVLERAVYVPPTLSPWEHIAWFPGLWTSRFWDQPIEPLRIALWAAILLALAVSRLPRRKSLIPVPLRT